MSDAQHLVPQHVGIIMDGNGRWAQSRGLPRSEGHKEGLKTAKTITKAAAQAGVKYLSLYVFSTENWKRAEQEVSFLMFLLKSHLLKEWDFYRENSIRVVHSGDLEGLPPEVRRDIRQVQEDTGAFTGLTVNLAINYGGQNEILRATERWKLAGCPSLTEDLGLRPFLDQPSIPSLDLVIRTAGELRLSNFLLWQSAYAELAFSDKFWPDWTAEDFEEALRTYQTRNRRFGGLDETNE